MVEGLAIPRSVKPDPGQWLTVKQWCEKTGRPYGPTTNMVSSGKIPSKLFREREVIPGSNRDRWVPMISSETVGPISARISKKKIPAQTVKGQRKLAAARRKAAKQRAKEEAEREEKLRLLNVDLDPDPFLGWIMSRPETDLQIAQKAGYADDRAIQRLWNGLSSTVRFEYVERVLKAHNRAIEDVYKDLKN